MDLRAIESEFVLQIQRLNQLMREHRLSDATNFLAEFSRRLDAILQMKPRVAPGLEFIGLLLQAYRILLSVSKLTVCFIFLTFIN